MNQKHLNAIGLMSGTSLDGIDVALLRSDGELGLERGPFMSVSYDDTFRTELKQALEDAKAIQKRADRPGNLASLEAELTKRHADAVHSFVEQNNLRRTDIDLIGFHGQTILHRPDDALTVQIGDGQLLADLTGAPVVYDMRANDIAHGGQGAPLAPAYHRALVENMEMKARGVAIINIGGISNISAVAPNGSLDAFDCGPGNVLIDQWIEAHTGQTYDEGGKIGLNGSVNQGIAERYLTHADKLMSSGRSLDRLDFPALTDTELSIEDGARTLAHITAKLVAASSKRIGYEPGYWILCGGGRLNQAIIIELKQVLADTCKVVIAEDAGIEGDAVEAEAWAYLAIRSVKMLPLTYPTTTGVREPMSGGIFVVPK